MKTTDIYQTQLFKIANFFRKIATAIVSGIPAYKLSSKPENKSIIYQKEETYKAYYEKHFHRPISRPAAEQQTLLKEKKKAKMQH